MADAQFWKGRAALVTGASAGLGRAVARALVGRGARLAIVARDPVRLQDAADELRHLGGEVHTFTGDLAEAGAPTHVAAAAANSVGELGFVCHAAGRSMRGRVADTSRREFEELIAVNFLAAAELAQAAAPSLEQTRGSLVLIGSLASRLGPRYLGAYPASKHPLSALAQQLRLEHGPSGMHTLLVLPGPIARDDAGERYVAESDGVPSEAQKPGGGAKLQAIDPVWLAQRILKACEQKKPELVAPAMARLLFGLSQVSPRLSDWIVRKLTSG